MFLFEIKLPPIPQHLNPPLPVLFFFTGMYLYHTIYVTNLFCLLFVSNPENISSSKPRILYCFAFSTVLQHLEQ